MEGVLDSLSHIYPEDWARRDGIEEVKKPKFCVTSDDRAVANILGLV
jgi:hypothetical protein